VPDLTGQPLRRFYGFTGAIDDDGATRLTSALNLALNDGVEEVHLCISSPGGYVHSGIYVYNHMRALPLKVVAYNTGSVASIAVAIFVGADERYCSQHGVFMIHPTQFPQLTGMTASLLQSTLDGALADDARTEAILRERANVPEALLTDRRARDVYINAADAVTYGLAHNVREFTLPEGNQVFQV
jgi:ATP-dependent protease ClpP protease subunit